MVFITDFRPRIANAQRAQQLGMNVPVESLDPAVGRLKGVGGLCCRWLRDNQQGEGDKRTESSKVHPIHSGSAGRVWPHLSALDLPEAISL